MRRGYPSCDDVDRSVRVIVGIFQRLRLGAQHVFADVARLNRVGGDRDKVAVELAQRTITAVFKDHAGDGLAEACAAAKRF